MDVSKNRGTPKWMVYNGKNPIKIDDLGVPLLLETPIYIFISRLLKYLEEIDHPCWLEILILDQLLKTIRV